MTATSFAPVTFPDPDDVERGTDAGSLTRVVRKHVKREAIFGSRDPVAALRKLSACEVARLGGDGFVEHCSAHRDAKRRELTVLVRWAYNAPPGRVASCEAGIRLDLGLWVAPGWTVWVGTALGPPPASSLPWAPSRRPRGPEPS